MSIGIIIFVISVIVTIISAINDNSHKERQKQQRPTHGQPQTKKWTTAKAWFP
ncbi:Uncharacterised protein [Staphylococcus gallinarum]|uniref:Uncharacterized protein n=1 Tax=Staphylococcus gallinarum TaxID=1293 RepID=A0A380FI38_STAGA|nr:Uncharacterised protein [Staphylococcus gallinarum]